MTWNLFVDDERFPPDDGREWIICRNMSEVMEEIVLQNGIPSYISFDHDLGESEPTGYDIAKMIVDMDMDGQYIFPNTFSYYIHSQNPIGKANIEGLLNNYMKAKKETTK